MHHQFKELAGLDISKEPMEVGLTPNVMGGVLVDANPKQQPGLFACGETPLDYMVQILGGNSLSDLLCLEKELESMLQSVLKIGSTLN